MGRLKQAMGLFLATLFLCTLAACGGTSEWQKQYDLGVKYLSTGDYEEAILAFTAAIDVDPKQADAYLQLMEAYTALDQPEDAERVRAQGYEATGDVRLKQDEEEPQNTGETDENLPWDQQHYKNYNTLTAAQQAAFRQIIAGLLAGDSETLYSNISGTGLAEQSTFTKEREGALVEMQMLRTEAEGYKIQVCQYQIETEQGVQNWIACEIRPCNGQGYVFEGGRGVQLDENTGGKLEITQSGTCVNWQYNGTMTGRVEGSDAEGYVYVEDTVGQATENFIKLDSIQTSTFENGEKAEGWSTQYYYEQGELKRLETRYADEGFTFISEFENGEVASSYITYADGTVEQMPPVTASSEYSANLTTMDTW